MWIGLKAGKNGSVNLVYVRVADAMTTGNNGEKVPARTANGRIPKAMVVAPLAVVVRGPVYLRVAVDEKALCRFSYSLDGAQFTPVGVPFQAAVDRWIGAKVGLFAGGTSDLPLAAPNCADFDWFRVTP